MDGKYQVGVEQIIQELKLDLSGSQDSLKQYNIGCHPQLLAQLLFIKAKNFNEWNGHALITSLKDKSLRKLIFNDKSNVIEEVIFKNKIGRIRDIKIHKKI